MHRAPVPMEQVTLLVPTDDALVHAHERVYLAALIDAPVEKPPFNVSVV